MNHNLHKYLQRRSVVRPLHGHLPPAHGLSAAVVIPAYAESAFLPLTLASLGNNDPEQLARTLVVVVVNNRGPGSVGAPSHEDVQDNLKTLRWLDCQAKQMPLQLAWIDAASPGCELPDGTGVGLARKIGCDSVLHLLPNQRLEPSAEPFLFFHLDADTLVQPDYLRVAGETLRLSRRAGGVVRFKHQAAASESEQRAIDAYESFLKYYVDGLKWAGSPYAFHTVGSAMLCTAAGYLSAGGFPAKRLAGEDFYFLQELAKVGGICAVDSTCVYPSPRPSLRVPFGTGPRVAQAVASGVYDFLVYDPRVFAALRAVLMLVAAHPDSEAEHLLNALEQGEVRQFLLNRDFVTVWDSFLRQFKHKEARFSAFHRWFDGFQTLKLVHHLSDTVWPRVPLSAAIAGLGSLISGQSLS